MREGTVDGDEERLCDGDGLCEGDAEDDAAATATASDALSTSHCVPQPLGPQAADSDATVFALTPASPPDACTDSARSINSAAVGATKPAGKFTMSV